MVYYIKFESLEGTTTQDDSQVPPAGADVFLAWYDPDAADGGGEVIWTTSLADALTFPSAEAAIALYRQSSRVRPWRVDGRPNRPMTAFTVSIVSGGQS